MAGSPRFVKAGGSNVLLSSAPALVESITLTAKSGAASLSVFASATSAVNVATQNRLLVRAGGVSSPATMHLHLGGSLWPTGIAVSCNGAGAVAVVNFSGRQRNSV